VRRPLYSRTMPKIATADLVGREQRRPGKSLIRITFDRWGSVAAGGFPPDRAPGA
jgi:hypothetical protein